MSGNQPILDINDLTTSFRIEGRYYPAIENIHLSVYKDEVLALVGESGCGKSTLATSIMGLHNMNTTKIIGSIRFEDKEIVGMTNDEMDRIRGSRIGMIFQDPLAALNPLQRVGDQVKECLDIHTDLSEEDKKKEVLELLDGVGIVNPQRTYRQFPHELSGGMRQRIMIAMAIACKPELIIADEPTTALDVTIQAQIMNLLSDIKSQLGTSILLITHDLALVGENADEIAVMYAGRIVEKATSKDFFENPNHPYSKALLNSMPAKRGETLDTIQGQPPTIHQDISGCRFHPRCKYCFNPCIESVPESFIISENHTSACFLNNK